MTRSTGKPTLGLSLPIDTSQPLRQRVDNMVQIENDCFQIHFDEAQGASILAGFIKRHGRLLPLMPDSRDPGCDLAKSCWIMAPYSNRIENGVFRFGGKTHRLQRGGEHSIHGDVRQRPWRIFEKTDSQFTCQFDSRDFHDLNWPWDFTIAAAYEVRDSSFRSTLTLTNASPHTMPAGFGWHPYFSRHLTDRDNELRLRVSVAGVYPDDNGNRIPSGPARPLLASEDFGTDTLLAGDRHIDSCFSGYGGDGLLHWPGTGFRLRFQCSGACRHLVLYTPAGKPYIAFEPVSNANNGVNLLAAGDSGTGIKVLPPGQSMAATLTMTACWGQHDPPST